MSLANDLHDYWYSRGADDARKGKASLFTNTKARGIECKVEVPDDWSAADERRAGSAYLEGYDSVDFATGDALPAWDGLNGAQVITHGNLSGVNYVRLPKQLQRPIDGGCVCSYCKAHPTLTPTWDTLAVPKQGTAWTVHMPELHMPVS